MGVSARPNAHDLRRWRTMAETDPDAWWADIVVALIREVERLRDEVKALRREQA